MKTILQYKGKEYSFNLAKPIDIAISLRASSENVSAWYLPPPSIEPVRTDSWIGSVAEGADVNFNTISFNPHAHGTHTECMGHITEKIHGVNKCMDKFFFIANLITVAPGKWKGDFVISKKQIENALRGDIPEALVIRTLPNGDDKLTRHYEHTNPPYLLEEAAAFLCDLGIEHLLIDLPSVDKEKDGGALRAHRAFWNENGKPRMQATITEFVYIPDAVKDGLYILDLQVASFENDASPSRPVLYRAGCKKI